MLLKIFITLLIVCAGPTLAITPETLVPASQAFQLSAEALSGKRLSLSWRIAKGHYLYRKRFNFVAKTQGITFGQPVFPAPETKTDALYGQVRVYRDQLRVELPLRRADSVPLELMLQVDFQGCSDAGVCYMPEHKTLTVALPELEVTWRERITAALGDSLPLMFEQNRIADSFQTYSGARVLLAFFGFGVLLAFTPCVFPMIPILSGIIAGQGRNLNTARAFGLSLSYVLAAALAYSGLGILAGLFGGGLQLFFQQPAVIIAFSAVFVTLALSMFGLFHLQLPAVLQTRVMALSARQQGGRWLGAAMMGILSALTVGPCVTAPLAGALLYIGKTGDAWLGGGALFCLGLGMGVPLLVIGTSAGQWLPKSGNWMKVTQYLFGFGLLAVAVWLLTRILPPEVNRWLWLALLMLPVVYLLRRKFWLTLVAGGFIYALLATLGIVTDPSRDYLQSLCVAAVACSKPAALPFQKIATLADLSRVLDAAQAQNRWLLLDVYADWCVACKEMELYTFADSRVKTKLAGTLLVQADVTPNSDENQAMLKKFALLGPPAVLFFNPEREEQPALRVIGFVDSEQFLARLARLP